MQCLEVSGAVRPVYGSLGVKRLNVKKCYDKETRDGTATAPSYNQLISKQNTYHFSF